MIDRVGLCLLYCRLKLLGLWSNFYFLNVPLKKIYCYYNSFIRLLVASGYTL